MAPTMLRLALLAGATLALAKKAATIEEDRDVLVLTEDNFDEAIKAHDPLLVEFYAPWCGHCKRLDPEYAAAAGVLKPDGLRIAKVDATVHSGLSSRFGVQGFPTLKFFRGGKATEYNGGREKDTIVSWVRKHSGPAAATLSTAADVAAFLAAHPVSVVAFGVAKGSAAEAAVLKAAAGLDDVSFAITADAAARAAHGKAAPAGSAPALVAFNNFEGEEEHEVAYAGDVTDDGEVAKWAAGATMPAVIAFSTDNAPKIFRGAIKTHMLLFIDVADAAAKPVLAAFRAAAKAASGRALFVTVGPSEDRVLSYFGVEAKDMPSLVLVNMPADAPMKKFKYTASVSDAAALGSFLGDFEAGKLKPFLKTEPAPDAAAEADAPVKTVTGGNFEAVVLAPDVDVLLEVYAPWCGHCKSLAPTYEKLGEAVAASGAAGKVVIAKTDGTANEFDYPGVNVKGFPTILLAKAGTTPKKMVEYDGARDLDGFVSWLKKHATNGAALAGAGAGDDEDEESEEEL